MKTTSTTRFLLSWGGFCLFFVLASCSAGHFPAARMTSASISAELGNTHQLSASSVSTGSGTATTPQVQTSCPPAGQARAAVMPPLALGLHHNIVYLVREFGA